MRLKKKYFDTTIHFEIIGNKSSLEKGEIIESIIMSLDGAKFIYKKQPFNDLVKEQQKYQKHVLVDFIPKPFDELRFIVKSIYNFLIETKQSTYFMIESIEFLFEDKEIEVYVTELLRENLNNSTFSPIIRSCWINSPNVIELILRKP